MKDYVIAGASLADKSKIADLYRAVAAIEGGLARNLDEITESYVENFLSNAVKNGIVVTAREPESEKIVGEIHAYTLQPRVFAHILSELTIAVHPEFQGVGVGRAIFTEFMRLVEISRPEILRVELIARESNQKAIKFYQSLGFAIEGKMVNRIRSHRGGFEADIPMAWLRKTDY